VLAAFRRSDGAEVDVIVTADGAPILRHDDRLPSGAPVRSLSLADVRRLTATDDDTCPHAGDVLASLARAGTTGLLDVELKVPGARGPPSARTSASSRSPRSSRRRSSTRSRCSPSGPRASVRVRRAAVRAAGLDAARDPPGDARAVRAAHPTMPLYAWTLNDAEAVAARAVGATVWIGDDVERLTRGATG
jgi:glycerophosphoryl diester phosphodiesterase